MAQNGGRTNPTLESIHAASTFEFVSFRVVRAAPMTATHRDPVTPRFQRGQRPQEERKEGVQGSLVENRPHPPALQ